jgi:hypothetical protein
MDDTDLDYDDEICTKCGHGFRWHLVGTLTSRMARCRRCSCGAFTMDSLQAGAEITAADLDSMTESWQPDELVHRLAAALRDERATTARLCLPQSGTSGRCSAVLHCHLSEGHEGLHHEAIAVGDSEHWWREPVEVDEETRLAAAELQARVDDSKPGNGS